MARVIAVTMGPHGHNGPGATQFIFVVDGDDALFSFAVLLHRSLTHIIFAGSTARGRHPDQHHIDLQTPVGVEFFIAVQFSS